MVMASIESNRSNEYGGGVYVKANSSVNVGQTTIARNYSNLGGGGLFGKQVSNTIIFDNSTVSDNTASMSGGGIHLENGALSVWRTAVLKNIAGLDQRGEPRDNARDIGAYEFIPQDSFFVISLRKGKAIVILL